MTRKKLKIYLAGSIEGATDLGKGWRKTLTPFLESLGFEVLDPCLFEPHQLKGLRPGRLPEGYHHWHQLKSAEDRNLVERFYRYMIRIINYDASVVENEADSLVVYWDLPAARGAGTHSEIMLAQRKHKAIYLVQGMEFKDIPGWVLGCVRDTGGEVFQTFEELKEYFKKEFTIEKVEEKKDENSFDRKNESR